MVEAWHGIGMRHLHLDGVDLSSGIFQSRGKRSVLAGIERKGGMAWDGRVFNDRCISHRYYIYQDFPLLSANLQASFSAIEIFQQLCFGIASGAVCVLQLG